MYLFMKRKIICLLQFLINKGTAYNFVNMINGFKKCLQNKKKNATKIELLCKTNRFIAYAQSLEVLNGKHCTK